MSLDDSKNEDGDTDKLKKLVTIESDKIMKDLDLFLKTLKAKFFTDKENINLINKLIKKSPRIGEESSVGQVFDIGEYVIKVMKLCGNNRNATFFEHMLCHESKEGNLLYKIPSTLSSKRSIMMPNYLSEGIISLLLNKLIPFTPCFSHTHGTVYDDENHKVFIVMEKLQPLFPIIQTEVFRFLYIIFQVTHALDMAQRVGRYVHFDLHTGNLMAKHNDKINVFRLQSVNVYTHFNFDPVIIDYGMNRMETNKYIITPKDRISPSPQDVFDYYEYNPYYDLYMFLYFLQYKLGLLSNEQDYFSQTDVGKMVLYFFSIFVRLGKKETIQDKINYYSHSDYLRPNPTSLLTKPPMTPAEFKYYIIAFVVKNYQNDIIDLSREDVIRNLKVTGFVVSTQYHDLGETMVYNQFLPEPKIPKLINIKLHDKFDGINIETFVMQHSSDPEKQYIHVASMIQNTPTYKFRFDCCRIDMKNVFEKENIHGGVTINASFFNVSKDYSPIGEYKSSVISGNFRPVPEHYKQDYGYVVIENNVLKILQTVNDKDKYENILTSGPLMIWNGERLFSRRKIENSTYKHKGKDVLMYQCRSSQSDSEKQMRFIPKGEKLIPNCEHIKPGELSHLSNQNPRSALCVDRDGNIKFVYVEGRKMSGDGMDIIQLTELCQSIGAVHAINLDGGGSSNILWMNPSDGIINQPNHFRNFVYPVGNTISFVKEI